MTIPELPPPTRFEWRHQYDPVRDRAEQALTDIPDLGPSLTQQHFSKDADINEIVQRFGIKDGSIPPAPNDPRFYADFTDVVDLRTALDRTIEAVTAFELLPVRLRNRFNNRPAELYEFVLDPANEAEAISLGLLKRQATAPAGSPARDPASLPADPLQEPA